MRSLFRLLWLPLSRKVKAEVKSRREALAAAVSMADSIEQENKAMLNRAKTVENEVRE